MELLINGLLRKGADRANLKAKVFGGANVTSNTNNIGARNIEFAFSFLESEGFQVETHSTGGNNALRIQFHGYSGAARAMRIPITHANAVEPSIAKPKPPMQSGEITLF